MLCIRMTGYVGGFVLSRRRFLWSTALASAGLTAGATAARAFALEEPAAGTIAEMRAGAAACAAASPYHAQVLADVRALLSGRDLPDEERKQMLAQATCPLCGCRVAS
jgi:hypothetical protein